MVASHTTDPFLDFDADDSGAQEHQVESDYGAVLTGIAPATA